MLRIPLLAVAATLLVAAPANAAAPTLKTATFKATISGNQVSTWSYTDPDDPNDPCDGASRGDGSQSINFRTKTVKLQVFKGQAMFKKASFVPVLTGTADIEREGDYAVANTPYDENACGPAVAIGDGGSDPIPQDCGTRSAEITLHPGYDHEPIEDDEGLVPLVPKGALFLQGELGAWLGYLECPYWIGGGQGPSETELLQSWEVYPDKRLFEKRRKSIVISGDRTQSFTAPGFTGKTLIAWNIRLKRVG